MLRPAILSVPMLFVCASIASAGLINSSFEYGQAGNSWSDHSDASINPSGGWFTTESDHQIEVWGNGYLGVNAYDGTNFAELNANAVSTLFQTTTGIGSGDLVDYHFAHRGRQGVDTMELRSRIRRREPFCSIINTQTAIRRGVFIQADSPLEPMSLQPT